MIKSGAPPHITKVSTCMTVKADAKEAEESYELDIALL